MADEINKPVIDPAEQDVLMREIFQRTPQPIPRMQEGGPVQEGGMPMPMPQGGMPMPQGGMPTGETANAGIMEGFNSPEGQAMAEKISTDFNNIKDFADVMNMIRGDEKTIDERKAELADVVGEEDAQATPDSSLTITQFGMKQITEANQQLEQGEEAEGIAGLPEGQEAINMDQGALMGAQPQVPQVPETVMPGMAFGGMVQRYAYGGEVTREGVPVQRFFPGGFALVPPIAGAEDELLEEELLQDMLNLLWKKLKI